MSDDDMETNNALFKIADEENERYGREFKNAIIRAIVAERLFTVFRARYLVLALLTGSFAWFFAIHGLSWKSCFGAVLVIVGIGVLIQSVKRFYLNSMSLGLGTPLGSTLLDNRIFGFTSLAIGVYLLW